MNFDARCATRDRENDEIQKRETIRVARVTDRDQRTKKKIRNKERILLLNQSGSEIRYVISSFHQEGQAFEKGTPIKFSFTKSFVTKDTSVSRRYKSSS